MGPACSVERFGALPFPLTAAKVLEDGEPGLLWGNILSAQNRTEVEACCSAPGGSGYLAFMGSVARSGRLLLDSHRVNRRIWLLTDEGAPKAVDRSNDPRSKHPGDPHAADRGGCPRAHLPRAPRSGRSRQSPRPCAAWSATAWLRHSLGLHGLVCHHRSFLGCLTLLALGADVNAPRVVWQLSFWTSRCDCSAWVLPVFVRKLVFPRQFLLVPLAAA